MTEWTPNVEAYDALDDTSVTTQPAPRTIRRSALRSAASRHDLYADVRAEARQVRGRDAFVWKGRVLPIGLPVAVAAALITWRRRRSPRDTVVAVLGAGVMSYLEARVEWSLRRRSYRRRRDAE
jgi:hypothetical protein